MAAMRKVSKRPLVALWWDLFVVYRKSLNHGNK